MCFLCCWNLLCNLTRVFLENRMNNKRIKSKLFQEYREYSHIGDGKIYFKSSCFRRAHPTIGRVNCFSLGEIAHG